MADNSNSTNNTQSEKISKIGLFLGCIIPTEQYAYELSLRKVLPELGIELIDLENFSCCGAPLRSINLNLSLYLSLRNLAVCEMAGLDLLAPCPICHLGLTEANNFMQHQDNTEDQDRYRSMLAEEGLEFTGEINIYHTLDLLHDVIGLEKIGKQVEKPLNELNFASHYGCHLIRTTETGRPDCAENPQKIERILAVLGSRSEDYPEKLNCCGGPLILNLPDSALTKTGQKLKAVQDRGFTGLVNMCPWGHRLFDTRQKNAADTVGEKLAVPVFYLTQLIGLTFGISPDELGLNLNLSPVDKIEGLSIFGDAQPTEAKTDDQSLTETAPPGEKTSNATDNNGGGQ